MRIESVTDIDFVFINPKRLNLKWELKGYRGRNASLCKEKYRWISNENWKFIIQFAQFAPEFTVESQMRIESCTVRKPNIHFSHLVESQMRIERTDNQRRLRLRSHFPLSWISNENWKCVEFWVTSCVLILIPVESQMRIES